MNKILTIGLLIMLVITSFALFATKESSTSLPADTSSGVAAIGGAFRLINQDGKTVSDNDFRGKYMLVFFGFTRCPDMCPLAMTNITAALEQLGEKADRITPVLISVDPKNDTPETLKSFLEHFDKRSVGLTGNEDQIKKVTDEYKAYYSDAEGGMVNHSGLIYLMNEKGEYVMHFAHDTAPDTLAKALAEKIK